MMFRIVFWDVLPCKMIVDRRFRGAFCLHHQGDDYFTWQYIPEVKSELHTHRSEKTEILHRDSNVCVLIFVRPSMTVKNINITIQINKLGYISGSHVDDTLLEYSTLKSH